MGRLQVKLAKRRCVHCQKVFQPNTARHRYCCDRCKQEHFRGNALKTDRRCSWCGARLDEDARIDARFCSSRCRSEAHSARPCLYCGLPAEGRDHLIPRSFVTTMIGSGIVPKKAKIIVPCCQECNGTAGATVFANITEKRRYIKNRYRVKYRKLLEAPVWTEEELSELGFGLRSRVQHSVETQRLLRARLRWPSP